MTAGGYIFEGVFFLVWSLAVSLISARQLWLMIFGIQVDNNKQKQSVTNRVPKIAQFLCFSTGFLGVIVNIDRRTLFGIYSVGFVSLDQLLMLCPVFCLGMVWFHGVTSIMGEAAPSKRPRIPIPVYYFFGGLDFGLTVVEWSIAVKTNQAWYFALKIVFNLVLLVFGTLLTLVFLVFLERSFKRVSANVITPESKVKRQTLKRKLWTCVGIHLLVLILGLIVVRGMVQDKSVAVTDLVPKNPGMYEWNSNSWTGASQLFIACIGIRMFQFDSPSDGAKTAGESRHSNKPVAEIERQASDQEGPRQPSVISSSDVTQKFHVGPQQDQI
jgi:hypothetical protein